MRKSVETKLADACARGQMNARETFATMTSQYLNSPSLLDLHYKLYQADAARLKVPEEVRFGKVQEAIDQAEIAAYVKEYLSLIETLSP